MRISTRSEELLRYASRESVYGDILTKKRKDECESQQWVKRQQASVISHTT